MNWLKEGNDAEREYAAILADFPQDIIDLFQDIGSTIPDEDIYTDPEDSSFGREDKPHATVKFGLHSNSSEGPKEILKNEGPISIKFKGVGHFSAKDKPYDVIIVELESKDLHRLNKNISNKLENTDTHPIYKPHATIAYVKKGTLEKYKEGTEWAEEVNAQIKGLELEISQLTFSGAEKDNKETLYLGELMDKPEPLDKQEGEEKEGYAQKEPLRTPQSVSTRADMNVEAVPIEVANRTFQLIPSFDLESQDPMSTGYEVRDNLNRKIMDLPGGMSQPEMEQAIYEEIGQELTVPASAEKEEDPQDLSEFLEEDEEEEEWPRPGQFEGDAVTIEDVPIMSPRERQERTDKLLEKYRAATPEERPRLEQMIKELASVQRAYMKRHAHRLAFAAYVFDPVQNPIPFPKPGQASGLWGYVYTSDSAREEYGTDDLDELWLLVENDRNLQDMARSELGDEFMEAAPTPIHKSKEAMAFLQNHFDEINKEYLYPFIENWQNKGAKEVIEAFQEIYGPERGSQELQEFMSRMEEGEREKFQEDAMKKPFESMYEELEKVKPSETTTMQPEDVPVIDPEAERDQVMDSYNKGLITFEEMESKMQQLTRAGHKRLVQILKRAATAWSDIYGKKFVLKKDLSNVESWNHTDDSMATLPAGMTIEVEHANDTDTTTVTAFGKEDKDAGVLVTKPDGTPNTKHPIGYRFIIPNKLLGSAIGMDLPETAFDEIGMIMAYESGELDEEGTLKLFQHLVDTGIVWKLQGHYGRTAADLLERGLIQPAQTSKKDYYGNVVPGQAPMTPGAVPGLSEEEWEAKKQELEDRILEETDPEKREQLHEQLEQMQRTSQLKRLAIDSDARAAYMRRVQLWKTMQTMDPNDPTYQDYKNEYNSLEAAAEEYTIQPTYAAVKDTHITEADMNQCLACGDKSRSFICEACRADDLVEDKLAESGKILLKRKGLAESGSDGVPAKPYTSGGEVQLEPQADGDKVDAAIEQAYYKYGQGVQINVMDVPKLFADVRAAVAEGRDLDQAVQDAIEKYKAGGERLAEHKEADGGEEVMKSDIVGGDKKPWLHGIENLTIDHEGYVYWKDQHIEHFTLSWAFSDEAKEQAEELARRARILEEQGKPVNSATVIWRWPKEEEKESDLNIRSQDAEDEPLEQPEEGDYVMQPDGTVGQYGKIVYQTNEQEEAETWIKQDMEEKKFFPNVWSLSDHGNLLLLEWSQESNSFEDPQYLAGKQVSRERKEVQGEGEAATGDPGTAQPHGGWADEYGPYLEKGWFGRKKKDDKPGNPGY